MNWRVYVFLQGDLQQFKRIHLITFVFVSEWIGLLEQFHLAMTGYC